MIELQNAGNVTRGDFFLIDNFISHSFDKLQVRPLLSLYIVIEGFLATRIIGKDIAALNQSIVRLLQRRIEFFPIEKVDGAKHDEVIGKLIH